MKRFVVWIFALLCTGNLSASDDIWSKTISLPKVKESSYELLNRISDASGYLFIYDSRTIDNDRKIRLEGGQYTIQQAVRLATGNASLQMRQIEQHILLYKKLPPPDKENPKPSFLSIEGTIKDKGEQMPLPSASVSIKGFSIGTISNAEGKFVLKIPDSLAHHAVCVSYMGYETQEIPAALLSEGAIDIYLNLKIVPIQEVVVHLVNPQKLLDEMMENLSDNYALDPAYLTTFYREGVNYKGRFVQLTEAVLQVYKRPFTSDSHDQVKALKMRRMNNQSIEDSVILRIKAGIESALLLDLIKNQPDFLTFNDANAFNYAKIDMSSMDNHYAHVIAFAQKPETKDALTKGELYIDADNRALLKARFEYNPLYIKQAKRLFILREPPGYDIQPQAISYALNYKQWNGRYYISYLRGDLQFNVRKKKGIFLSNNTFRSFFEMAVCQIDTSDVKSFSSKERLDARQILSKSRFVYDADFWGDFNFILPDESLIESFDKIVVKIEESELLQNAP